MEERLERAPPPCRIASNDVLSQNEKPWLALRSAGECVGAGTDAGAGAGGSWLSEGKISCARKMPAQSASMKMYLRQANGTGLRE
jgi:hypothetical protein